MAGVEDDDVRCTDPAAPKGGPPGGDVRADADCERVLLVQADTPARRVLVEILRGGGYVLRVEADGVRAVGALRSEGADLLLSALALPGDAGQALLAHVRAAAPWVPVVVLARPGTAEGAVMALRGGAVDYLAEPFDASELLAAVRGALAQSRRAGTGPGGRRGEGSYLDGLIGRSQPMLALYDQIGRVAASTAPVLITGATGSGKEVVAAAVHRASGRGAFVDLNCAAIPPQLMESELFGHEKGAFTGAVREKRGLFERADGGTLLLDEVAELRLELQAKLLRVLQSGELRRVGAVENRRVDVRILAATHRDLRAEVRAGAFRSDLFFRIHVLHLHVPALRERRTDIPLLAEHFLARITAREGWGEKRITPAALAALVEYSWPGNVRELLNVIERAAILSTGAWIEPGDLPDEVVGGGRLAAATRTPSERRLTLAEFEREYVLEVLRLSGGNRTLAAEWLGLPRRTLYRRLHQYGLLPVP
jgi:two-component system response regulator AtoC